MPKSASVLPIAAGFAVCALAGSTVGAVAKDNKNSGDCFAQLEQGRGPEIVCEFPTRLTGQEQKDLQRITRDVLQDARCTVSIRVDRALVETALTADDHVFTVPPQPMRCEIQTRETVMVIMGSFSPRVVFARGQAVEATPGLTDVQGVTAVLSWPVVQYVNRSSTIKDGMLAAINAYRAHRAARASAGGGKG